MSGQVVQSNEEVPDGYKRIQLGPREAVFPESWAIHPVGELFNIQKESFDPDSVDADSNVMLYSMPAYDEGRQPDLTMADEIGSKKYHVPNDTLLFPKLNIRKRRFWRVTHEHDLPAVCSTEYWPLLPTEQLNLDFYRYYFDSYEFMRDPKVTSSSSTNSHKRVKESSFKKLRLPVPPLPEQQQIADILSTVDEQIQQTKDAVKKKTELKRGLAQDLYGDNVGDDQFPDRASELPSGWSREKIADLCTIGGGSTPSKSNADYWGGNILWASPKDFDGPLLEGTEDKITEFATQETSLSTYETGSIAIVVRSGVLRHTLPVAQVTTPTTVNQDVKVLQPNENEVDPEYLFQILRMQSNRIRQRCMKTGTTVESIETSFLKKYKLRIPPLDKQQQIAGLLKNLDKEIRLEQEHRGELTKLKRGLMQDLLTGKRRVDPSKAD